MSTDQSSTGPTPSVGIASPDDFPVDRERRSVPYPGLEPYGETDADAALFFGRQREIQEILRRLEAAPMSGRPIVIVARSGAGKTSLLRAGLLLRLRRSCGVVSVNASQARLILTESGRHSLRDRIGRAAAAAATPVVGVDAGDPRTPPAAVARWIEESRSLDARLLLTATPEQLNGPHRPDDSLFERYELHELPRFRIDEVVVGPARRYGVKVDASLVDALIEDARGPDALPALAFVLRRLWSSRTDPSRLTFESYRAEERLRGIVEAACEGALLDDDDLDGQRPPPDADGLGARTFVPGLLRLDEAGMLIAQTALGAHLDAEGRSVLERFVRAGLVVHDTEEDSFRVAHPALFRLWFRVDAWLAPTREQYRAQLHLKSAAALWHRRGRQDRDLQHADERVLDASRHLASLLPVEIEYIRRCDARRDELRRRRRQAWALTLSLALVSIISAALLNRSAVEAQWRRSVRTVVSAAEEFRALTPEEEGALKPGDVFKECRSQCPEMVVIPAGSFMMGDEREEDSALLPRHRVTIRRPFAVGRTEVTVDEIGACVQLGGCTDNLGDAQLADGRVPINFVAVDDAQHYVDFLSRQTGRRYRLLSSAEWEYVARAGSDGAYSWGDEFVQGRAHCVRGCGSPFQNVVVTQRGFVSLSAPVASFEPNAFGVFDAHGNVWERVQDCFHPTYDGAPTDGSARTDPYRGRCRPVIRGGGWGGAPDQLRSAVRDWLESPQHDVGFRVARDLEFTPGPAD